MPSPNPTAASPPAGGPALLLVEDNDTYRQVVAMALGQYLGGCRVIEAVTVEAAVAALRSHAVGVVITDVTLPDGSALDLIEKSQDLIRSGVKFVVFSNHSRDDMLPMLDRAGVHSYVEKTRGLKVLAQAVQAAIDHEPHALPPCH
jgi:DNA-binding NarL/FixJ family response regulator